MIIDITGVKLTPGIFGKDCKGNGEHYDENGELIECCCDECDFFKCCESVNYYEECEFCTEEDCPRKWNLI